MSRPAAVVRSEPAVLGAAAWVATTAAGAVHLSLVDALLLLAVLVVAPLAVPLHPAGGRRSAAVTVVAGLPVVPALLAGQGPGAGALVVPWLVAAIAGAGLAIAWWWSGPRRPLDLVWVAAPAYLVVGAVWLLADRLGLEPAGVAAPFVALTAIHFHHAGFASSLLAGCAWRWRPGPASAVAALLVMAAPPVVAAGFTAYGPLQVVGAVLLTAGLWLLAWLMVRRIGPGLGGAGGALLVVSGVATAVPMVLAVQWAVGANYGTPAASIADMARFHGVTNAVGFVLAGVAGWRLGTGRGRPSGGAGTSGGER